MLKEQGFLHNQRVQDILGQLIRELGAMCSEHKGWGQTVSLLEIAAQDLHQSRDIRDLKTCRRRFIDILEGTVGDSPKWKLIKGRVFATFGSGSVLERFFS